MTVLRNGANAIPWAAAVPEQDHVPAGPGGEPPEIPHRPFVPEQPYVPPVIASTPTVWETGLQMIRNTIKKYANDIMQRNTLMTEMPASNYDSWRIWGLRLKEQSQRCRWGAEYTWEVAALDALMYQCPDPHWKTKILRNPKWTFQEALDYGISTLTSKKQSQALGAETGKSDQREELPLDRVADGKPPQKEWWCRKCMSKHPNGSCKAWGKVCGACGQKNHFSVSSDCRNSNKPGGPPQRGGGQGRGRGGGRNQGQGSGKQGQDQRQSGAPPSTTKTVFRKEGKNWVKKKQTVNYVEETVATDDDSEEDFEYACDRVLDVNKVGSNETPTTVRIQPTRDADYRTKVPWTTDSGVRKTLLSEKHYWKIRSRNPDIKLQHTNVQFRPYSTNVTVPLLGCMEVKLTNNNGKSIKTKVYVTEGRIPPWQRGWHCIGNPQDKPGWR